MSGDTLASIAAQLSNLTGNPVSVEDLAADPGIQGQSVMPLGVILIPPFAYTTTADQTDSLGKIAQQYSTTPDLLALTYANQQVDNLFLADVDHQTANVPGLTYLDVGSILDYFNANQSYTALSGMVTRYQLHGMRLPTDLPGLTLSPGSTCSGTDCALYLLTGQQFTVPGSVAEGFAISLVNSSLDWLYFNDNLPTGDPASATLTVTLTAEDISQINTVVQFAQGTGLKPDVKVLQALPAFDLMPQHYNFRTVSQWNCSGTIVLPYGSAGDQTALAPLIWDFSDGLLRQIA